MHRPFLQFAMTTVIADAQKPAPAARKRLAGNNYWFVEENLYDFSEFMYMHPGGNVWFPMNNRRDITILFHTYHDDPERLRPILEKYRIERKPEHTKKVALPPFLLKPDFDAEKDVPKYDFKDENMLLPKVRAKLNAPEMKAKIKFQNLLFDLVCYVLFAVYVLMSVSLVLGWLSPWLTVPMLTILRTSLAGCGHYYVHAKKPNWGDVLFDINYVGTSLTAFDGHVMLHHAYTQSAADVKTSFFFSMLSLPTIWRIPGYTLHKLGNMLFGNLARGIQIHFSERSDIGIFHESFWYMRALLMVEFWGSVYTGQLFAWSLQYFFSLWFNTWMVLSSHEFEHYGNENPGNDWGAFQVLNSYDMQIIGNPYIDLFLSAGLSPHRAHHLLPNQPSGLANIASEPIIRDTMKDFGLEWVRPKNFWVDRLPIIMDFIFNSPMIVPNTGEIKRKRDPGFANWLWEQFSLEGVVDFIVYIVKGTIGIGAI
jgi:cytochrome b involved in lipid metabolism